jgi:hypothetical protein
VAVYVICVAAQLVGPYPALVERNFFSIAVLLFLLVTVCLHVAAVVTMRSWSAAIFSVASIAALAALIFFGLMKITGDSL